MSTPSLQDRAVLTGGGYRYHCEASMPLSIKSFEGGAAHYRTETGSYSVDENSWLALNDQEPYSIEFDSNTFIRSTVVFFPKGWAENVARGIGEPTSSLIDDPEEQGTSLRFLQTVSSQTSLMKQRLVALDKACRGKRVREDWLEEQLNELLATLVFSQHEHKTRAAKLSAAKRPTRLELYRRLCRGRDFLHAYALAAPTLQQASQAASLSPYHFQRCFKAAFGMSPRQYTEQIRLQHARRLLLRKDLPTLEIATMVGYESYGAFHAAFRKQFGQSPSLIAN